MSERERKTTKLSDRPATVGRILIYTFTGEEHEHMQPEAAGEQRPAIVVRAYGAGHVVNVQVLTDGCSDVAGGGPGADGSLRLTSLQIAAEPTPGYLSWPVTDGTKRLQSPRVSDVVTVPGEGDLKAKKSKRAAG
jgi:hypothetical protein